MARYVALIALLSLAACGGETEPPGAYDWRSYEPSNQRSVVAIHQPTVAEYRNPATMDVVFSVAYQYDDLGRVIASEGTNAESGNSGASWFLYDDVAHTRRCLEDLTGDGDSNAEQDWIVERNTDGTLQRVTDTWRELTAPDQTRVSVTTFLSQDGRVISAERRDGAGQLVATTAFQWDDGRLTQESNEDHRITYAYDGDGRLVEIVWNSPPTQLRESRVLHLDANGRLERMDETRAGVTGLTEYVVTFLY